MSFDRLARASPDCERRPLDIEIKALALVGGGNLPTLEKRLKWAVDRVKEKARGRQCQVIYRRP